MALYQDDQYLSTHPSAQYGCRWRSIKMINIHLLNPRPSMAVDGALSR